MKVSRITTFLLITGLLGMFTACSKDETTMPAAVDLQMELNSQNVNVNARMLTNEGQIHIEVVQYRISAIDFEGYRENGEDYFFTRTFENPKEVEVRGGVSSSVLNFDMPQGVYERISIALQLKRQEAGEGIEPLAAYENAPILMKGHYVNNRQEEVPLLFVYNFDESLGHAAQSSGGEREIPVRSDHTNVASISFDAAYWMQLINARMLQGAKLSEYEGRPTIIISEDQNDHIFNLLVNRLENAGKLTFR